jgi:hypothetical protein
MNSRYCEVDLLSNTASELFWNAPRGWQRVRAVCSWVHSKVTFGYEFSNPTRTALGCIPSALEFAETFSTLPLLSAEPLIFLRAMQLDTWVISA